MDKPNSNQLADRIKAKFGELVSSPAVFREEVTLTLSDSNSIVPVLDFAKQELGFNYLVDITSLDNYGDDPRFTIVYHLYGYEHGCYLRLKTDLSEEKPELP